MAFPTIPTTGNGRLLSQNQNNTTAARTFPSLTSLTKNSGDLLVAIAVAYQRSAAGATFGSWGGGFTELADVDGGGSTDMAVGIATKTSTGSETGTFTVTQAATVTGHVALFLMSIPGWLALSPPEVTALAVGTAAAADPGSLNPSGWGTTDTLWIAVAGNGETNTGGSWTGLGTPTAPTNYTNANSPGIGTDAVGGIHGAVSFRQNAVAAEDVGTWGGQDVSNARNCALLIAVRGITPITVNLTHAPETDSATALSYNASFYDLGGIATETDSVNGVVPLQPFPATETNSALTLTRSTPIVKTITQAAETDTAQALDKDKVATLVHASETDTAQAVSYSQSSTYTLVHASETDSAPRLMKALGLARETDTAQTLDVDKPIFKTVTLAAETDTAEAVSFSQAGAYDIVHAAETNTAQALDADKAVDLVHASETDSANGIVALQPFPAVETDSAQALSFSQAGISLTPAVETDSAQALTVSQPGTYTITPAVETSSAQAVDKDKLVTLPEWEATPPLPYNTVPAVGDTSAALELSVESGANTVNITPALESDSAQAVDADKPIHKTLTVAAETNAAQVITYSQAGAFSIAPATETDSATTLDRDKTVDITFSTETDSAIALSVSQPGVYTLVRAQETDSAQTLTFTKPIVVAIQPATETDTAQPLPFGGVYLIEPTTETDVAVALVYGRVSPPGYIVGRSTGRIARSPNGRVAKTKQGVLA